MSHGSPTKQPWSHPALYSPALGEKKKQLRDTWMKTGKIVGRARPDVAENNGRKKRYRGIETLMVGLSFF